MMRQMYSGRLKEVPGVLNRDMGLVRFALVAGLVLRISAGTLCIHTAPFTLGFPIDSGLVNQVCDFGGPVERAEGACRVCLRVLTVSSSGYLDDHESGDHEAYRSPMFVCRAVPVVGQSGSASSAKGTINAYALGSQPSRHAVPSEVVCMRRSKAHLCIGRLALIPGR